ncbi:radical SAM protein [candidate division CSSED10-310 bacterium]|uniref:Radical SAM protein n=1 Tax=candidate division CSSED10-310 bacterium TaxID=2855610 RepID=A0ABV6Z5W5_UNCC1
MLLSLKNEIVYGPVNSRRLGQSLGINIFPGRKKICTFNCLYCQYGFAPPVNPIGIKGSDCVSAAEILQEVERILINQKLVPSYITFSGNGEPTLHPSFPEIVSGIINIRDRLVPTAKTAILSNSTMVHVSAVREALIKLDLQIMKLEVGTEEALSAYNKPSPGITFTEIVAGLSMLHKVTIQALFSGGPQGNFNEDNIEGWLQAMKMLKPVSAQIYSLSRTAPTRSITRLEKQDLMPLKSRLDSENITATVF